MICHKSEIDGPADYYFEYLKRLGLVVYKLDHPLDNYGGRCTVFSGKRSAILKRSGFFGPINLFFDFIISVWFIMTNGFDIFIGANNFDTFVGIFSRKFFGKKIKKIIFFASDFSEDRFNSAFLNRLYYALESVCCQYSDLVVSNTNRAQEKRLNLGLKKEKSVVVPNGIFLKNPGFPIKELNKRHFIYVGSVTKEHGLYDLIKTVSPLMEKIVLIGSGDDWDRVIGLCNERKIETEIHFRESHEFCINFLQNFDGFGLAPYNLESKWTFYCSPLKVVEYVACGLPILMSSLPEIFDEIKSSGLGIVYSELNADKISGEIAAFDIAGFNLKAKRFYGAYSQDRLYSRIILV